MHEMITPKSHITCPKPDFSLCSSTQIGLTYPVQTRVLVRDYFNLFKAFQED